MKNIEKITTQLNKTDLKNLTEVYNNYHDDYNSVQALQTKNSNETPLNSLNTFSFGSLYKIDSKEPKFENLMLLTYDG